MQPIARLLSTVTAAIVEEMHRRLAEQGHPGLRPAHGYALNAVGDGTTTAALGAHLGMTKQGAAKLVADLEGRGYLRLEPHASDRRARVLVLTRHGRDLLRRSAAVQEAIEAEWAAEVGERRVATMRAALEARAGDAPLRPAW